MRKRSAKMEAIYRKRRPFVSAFLEEHPLCQRCLSARSTVVHEKQTRARRGDILDPENCVAFCETCHQTVHLHPAQATKDGWLISGKKKIGA